EARHPIRLGTGTALCPPVSTCTLGGDTGLATRADAPRRNRPMNEPLPGVGFVSLALAIAALLLLQGGLLPRTVTLRLACGWLLLGAAGALGVVSIVVNGVPW